MRPVLDDLAEQATEYRTHLRVTQAPGRDLLDDGAHVLVLEDLERAVQCDSRLRGHSTRRLRTGEPRPHPSHDVDLVEPAPDHLGGEEVVPDERAQALPQRILAGRDQCGVWDRQPERSTKQSRHREPVRQATDHRSLRGGGYVPRPGGAVGCGRATARNTAADPSSRPVANALARRSLVCRSRSAGESVRTAMSASCPQVDP